MRTDRDLLTRALNYLQLPGAYAYIDGIKALREEIRARLAEKEEEPVAWAAKQGMVSKFKQWEDADPLYRNPRQPVRLSDAHIDRLITTHGGNRSLARAVERAIWEKNK